MLIKTAICQHRTYATEAQLATSINYSITLFVILPPQTNYLPLTNSTHFDKKLVFF